MISWVKKVVCFISMLYEREIVSFGDDVNPQWIFPLSLPLRMFTWSTWQGSARLQPKNFMYHCPITVQGGLSYMETLCGVYTKKKESPYRCFGQILHSCKREPTWDNRNVDLCAITYAFSMIIWSGLALMSGEDVALHSSGNKTTLGSPDSTLFSK